MKSPLAPPSRLLLGPGPSPVDPSVLDARGYIRLPFATNVNMTSPLTSIRYGGLPWDIILGSSISGFYKPHPQTYLKSVEALNLRPEQVCMVAAHQADLAYAAGHGMQTAFVTRPDEFGGPVKPQNPEAGVRYMDMAEIYPERAWTYLAQDFLDLAGQMQKDHFPH